LLGHLLVITFAQAKTENMDATKKSTGLDWIIFFVSLVAIVLLLMYADEWFWLALPFVLTYFVKAIRVI
jgi:hypothetical protein